LQGEAKSLSSASFVVMNVSALRVESDIGIESEENGVYLQPKLWGQIEESKIRRVALGTNGIHFD
jgi:hypothetical protein